MGIEPINTPLASIGGKLFMHTLKFPHHLEVEAKGSFIQHLHSSTS